MSASKSRLSFATDTNRVADAAAKSSVDWLPDQGSNLRHARRAPASYYLGILGMPGITAWIGSNETANAHAGETVVVSAASGAVGGVAGQLVKLV